MDQRSRSSTDTLPDGWPARPDDVIDLRPGYRGIPEERDVRLGVSGLPSGAVRRVGRLPRLAEIDAGVVVVAAPAGYGKTTLIGEWAQLDERLFVRVTMSEQENEARTFAESVIRSLASVQPRHHAPLALARHYDVDASLELLGSVLGQPRNPFVLVLDDVHLLSSPDSDAVVHVLVDHLPRGSQLVLVGRRTSQFHLARLRAHRELFELDAADLAFRDDEAEAMLSDCGAHLSREAITALTERAEGWPAGLYLATLSLR